MNRIQIIRGNDVPIAFEFTDSNDAPIDLTDCVVFFTVKRRKSDSDEDAVIAINQDTHTEPEEGKTQIEVPRATTENLKLGDYYWDTKIRFADGKIRSSVFDILTVIPNITERDNIVS